LPGKLGLVDFVLCRNRPTVAIVRQETFPLHGEGTRLSHARLLDGRELERQLTTSFYYRLPLTAVSAVLILTAISIKARAARLKALSLRKTRARSRRICASARGIAARTLAFTSSWTFEREINPIPTSAATKRFSSSLESSSMA